MRYLIQLFLCALCLSTAVQSEDLGQFVQKLEGKLQARIGVYIVDVKSGKSTGYRQHDRFPLNSTFKTLACAALLHQQDQGMVSLTQSVTLSKTDIVPYSPVTQNFIGKKFTLNDACAAAMHYSDNTAANLVLQTVGGPAGLTQFLRKLGDTHTRVDRYEPEINITNIPQDTTTPQAIATTLHTLIFKSPLSPPSLKHLKDWMAGNKVTDTLIRQVIPKNWRIEDRSGAGDKGSRSITAIIYPTDQNPFIISIYITDTNIPFSKRNQAIRDISAFYIQNRTI